MTWEGPWAVVAHDAGGAEVLSSYVRRRRLNCRFSLSGPARKVFERKLGMCEIVSVAAAVQDCVRLLCSTSWQSDFELSAIKCARAAGIPSIAWLDHWTNYPERFIRDGVPCLPDEIWVGDAYAEAIARERLPGIRVTLRDNPYLEDVIEELAEQTPLYRPNAQMLSVLYVAEPVREPAQRMHGDPLYYGYTEEQALRFFLDHLDALGRPVGRIVIRRHPSEEPDKYRDIAADFPLPISFSEGSSLVADVSAVDCVVGCGSMALVVALLAGKRVVSCIPPGGGMCPLPHSAIEHLRDTVGGSGQRGSTQSYSGARR